MLDESFDNRFRHGNRNLQLGENTPPLFGACGPMLAWARLDDEIGQEMVLFLTEPTEFAHELSRKHIELRLNTGVAHTKAGPVLFFHWWIPPITKGKPFALYEQILNPASTAMLEGLRQIARQTHLHMILLGPGQETLATYEFENTFGVEELIPISEIACREDGSRMNFTAAKQEYDQTYDLMQLFRKAVQI